MQLIWIASLCFAVLIAIFAVQNTAPVTVWLLAWRIESVAVSTLVLAAAALGALTTYLFGLARGIRSRVALRGNRSTIRDQDALIADLRTRVRELERENEAYRPGMEALPRTGGQLPPATDARPGSEDAPARLASGNEGGTSQASVKGPLA